MNLIRNFISAILRVSLIFMALTLLVEATTRISRSESVTTDTLVAKVPTHLSGKGVYYILVVTDTSVAVEITKDGMLRLPPEAQASDIPWLVSLPDTKQEALAVSEYPFSR